MSFSGQESKNALNGDEVENDTTSSKELEQVVSVPIPANMPISGTLANSTSKSMGVRKAEVLNDQYQSYVWRVILFVTVLITAYAYAVEMTVKGTIETYAVASFNQHALKSTVGVVQAVAAAAAQPTYARLSDRFGRLELIIVALVLYVIGSIVQFTSKNVDALSAGTVLYAIGIQGIIVLLQIVLADFSTLNWRLACSFIPALPFIINTWVSGDIVSSLYPAHSWQYGYGIWTFVFPLCCVPLVACFAHMRWLASKTPEWKALKEEGKLINKWKSWSDNIVIDVFWEVDVIGILLIICVFGFILVPFTIAGGVNDTWKKASTIVPLVIGVVLIPVLAFHEMRFAKFPLLPIQLMKDRGVWSAIIVAVFINMLWYLPNEYIYTVLVVGMNASIKAATRISSLYSFVSVIVGPLLGLLVTRVRRLKGFIIFGVLCWVGSFAILYTKRGDPDASQSQLNGVIGGLCLMGFGAGFFTYSTQVSISTCTNHEYMAVVISIYLASYNIGSALGSSISGATWTNTMYKNLAKEFEAIGFTNVTAAAAYGDPFTFAINYTWGTPERAAMVRAMAKTQKILCLIALVLSFVLLLDVFFLRDHRLDTVQSLELDHSKEEGIKSDDGGVIVNNYDDDFLLNRIKSLFKRGEK
ncbi:hypothetical protein PSN45_004051 [Yamadazyma tenuis]|uniref:MFS general substrate transporter n=1 Tax=Candida tenuis (strain ATCC 10573 / BCRC 21748 / CBS 615 / JCM 9827 / NBRC 10315 / NRRL Y-1498 / VKM Y-70) TaxID=590646 RepID=G3B4U7_CANTC|nr:MFS general substrate transporter [Yamadazyma tenuis ATCC 10573]EGV63875.1 MFS general substrate transporter [Yamadazyma tenuis ATCC 10573]WEJ96512.1 hypothetical protein PSN45_004051 [Yamadazyma tenuis]